MPGYYFDIRDCAGFSSDEEGVELSDVKSAEAEAALVLTAMARQAVARMKQQKVAVEVRTDEGPLFQVSILFEVRRTERDAKTPA